MSETSTVTSTGRAGVKKKDFVEGVDVTLCCLHERRLTGEVETVYVREIVYVGASRNCLHERTREEQIVYMRGRGTNCLHERVQEQVER